MPIVTILLKLVALQPTPLAHNYEYDLQLRVSFVWAIVFVWVYVLNSQGA